MIPFYCLVSILWERSIALGDDRVGDRLCHCDLEVETHRERDAVHTDLNDAREKVKWSDR